MKRTTSVPTASVPTEAEARAAMEGYTKAHIAETAITARTNKLTEAIKARADREAAPHREAKARHTTVLMRYAEARPSLFKKTRKTEIYGGHKIGYHTNPPEVTFVRPTGEKKKQDTKGFIATCLAKGRKLFKNFVRQKVEPDKAAILSYHSACKAKAEARNKPGILERCISRLASAGVEVTQTQVFVIDLNLEAAPETTTQTQQAA